MGRQAMRLKIYKTSGPKMEQVEVGFINEDGTTEPADDPLLNGLVSEHSSVAEIHSTYGRCTAIRSERTDA